MRLAPHAWPNTKKPAVRRAFSFDLLSSFGAWRSRFFLRRGGGLGLFLPRFLLRLGSLLFLLRLLLACGFGVFGAGFFLRSGLLLAGGRLLLDLRLVADELDDGHLRGVAAARSEPDDARVS